MPQDPFSTLTIAEYFGIHPMVTDNVRTGGSSFQIQAMWAALALDAGLCDVALIAYGSNQRFAAGKLKYRESVVAGIDNAPKGLMALLHGENFGKQLVRLA